MLTSPALWPCFPCNYDTINKAMDTDASYDKISGSNQSIYIWTTSRPATNTTKVSCVTFIYLYLEKVKKKKKKHYTDLWIKSSFYFQFAELAFRNVSFYLKTFYLKPYQL